MEPSFPDTGLSLTDAIRSLRAQLLEAIEEAEDAPLTFAVNALEIEFQLVANVVTRGEVRAGLWSVLTAGGGVEQSDARTHRVKITLDPVLRERRDPADPRTHVNDD